MRRCASSSFAAYSRVRETPSSKSRSDSSRGRSPSSRLLTIVSRRASASSKPGCLEPFFVLAMCSDLRDRAPETAAVKQDADGVAGTHRGAVLEDRSRVLQAADRVAAPQDGERGQGLQPLGVGGALVTGALLT